MESAQVTHIDDKQSVKIKILSEAWTLLADLIKANLLSQQDLELLKEKTKNKNEQDTINILRNKLYEISLKEDEYDPHLKNQTEQERSLTESFDKIDNMLRIFTLYWFHNNQEDGTLICPIRLSSLTNQKNIFIAADSFQFNEQDIAVWHNITKHKEINPWTSRNYNPRDLYRLNQLQKKYFPQSTPQRTPANPRNNEDTRLGLKLWCGFLGFFVGIAITFSLIAALLPFIVTFPVAEGLAEPVLGLLSYGGLLGGVLFAWAFYKISGLIANCYDQRQNTPAAQAAPHEVEGGTTTSLLQRIQRAPAPLHRNRSYEGLELEEAFSEPEFAEEKETFSAHRQDHHMELSDILATEPGNTPRP